MAWMYKNNMVRNIFGDMEEYILTCELLENWSNYVFYKTFVEALSTAVKLEIQRSTPSASLPGSIFSLSRTQGRLWLSFVETEL